MSYMTGETFCSTSFGLYQIMLENVYGMGYAGTVLDFWKNPDVQLIYFTKFLELRNINYSLDDILNDKVKRDDFSHHYNGALTYGDRLLKIYEVNKGN